jgi:hypothetical protein
MKTQTIDIAELKKTFRLNNEGRLERLYTHPGTCTQLGVESGTWMLCSEKPSGRYVNVNWNGKMFRAHRIIWALTNGKDPGELTVDHANGVKTDNRPENLRLATMRQQSQNRCVHRAGHLVGSYWQKLVKKWEAQISIDGKSRHLGFFDTAEEAHTVYLHATAVIPELRLIFASKDLT